MYASLAKSESRTLLAMSIRISEAGKKEDHVHMLFLIAYMIRYQSREERASVLEVDGFDERLQMLDNILKREYDRIKVVRWGWKTYIYSLCSTSPHTGGDVGWQSYYALVVRELLLSFVG